MNCTTDIASTCDGIGTTTVSQRNEPMSQPYPPGNPLHGESLKLKQRDLRDGFTLPLALRVHRAVSWLRRADTESEDLDVCFILLWIGFNAAYAGDLDRALDGAGASNERARFDDFFAAKISRTM